MLGPRSIASTGAWIAASVLAARSARAEAVPTHPPAAPRSLTLAAAIDVALSHNPQLAIEGENIAAAEARATADSRLRLPLFNLRANVLLWDSPITVRLADAEITIRDRVTGTVDLSVSQPVSGALVIGTLVRRDQALTRASRARRDSVRIDLAYQTAETYLSALQARTLEQIAVELL